MANEAEIIASNILSSAIEYKRLYDTTKNNEYKVKEQRLRRIAENVKLLLSSSSTSSVNSFNGRTGAVVLTSADVTGALGYTPPTNLNGLTDVTISAPANAQVLTYNSTTSQWENQTPAGGGGGGDMLKATYDTDNSGIVDKAEALTTLGRNSTGATLYEGTIVRIEGSTGNRPNFVKAQANNDANSAQTFGVVMTDIANNSDGYVLVQGTLHDLDTRTGAGGATHPFTDVTLVDGDLLFLHPTIAGYVTNIKPSAPQHLVYVGVVTRTSPTNGTIVYRIQNGYELYELHDVAIASEVNNDLLVYESSTDLWKNKSISTIFGGTPLVSVPTLAQVTTAGNTTTNAITVGGLTVGQVGGSGTISFPTTTSGFAASIFTQYASNSLNLRVSNTYVKVYGSGQIELTGSTTITGITGAAALVVQQGNAAWSPVADFNGSAGTALRVNTNGNILIGTTTDAGYKLDVNGIARVVTRIDAGTFTPGAGASAYTFATTGTITAAGGYNLRSPIFGDSGFSGLADNSGPTIYANNAPVARFNNIGGALNGTSVDILQSYNPGAGTGNVVAVRHSYALYPTADNTVSYTSFSSTPYWNSAPFYNRITGTIRGFYFANGLYNTQKLVDVIAFQSVGGRVIFEGELPSASAGISRGVYINQTHTAAANNDVLVGLDINPTFTNGAFTGVTNVALRTQTGNVLLATTSGNVGIGTTSPQHKLDITVDNVQGLRVQSNNSGFLEVGRSFGSKWRWTNDYTAANILELLVNNLVGGNPNQNVLTVFGSTKNISIGTTTDAGYKLDVNGTARIQGNTNITGFLSATSYLECRNQFLLRNGLGGGHTSFNIDATNLYLVNSTSINFQIGYSGNYSFILNNADRTIGMADNGATAITNASSVLTLTSTTKGFLQPRMTNAQAVAIATPATGLQAYDTTNNKNLLYNGTAWQNIATESWVSAQGYAVGTPTLDQVVTAGNSVANNGITITKASGATLTLNPGNSDNAIVINNNGFIKFTSSSDSFIRGSSSTFVVLDAGYVSKVQFHWGGSASWINTGGNLLIGTTTDAGYKLDVNGTARIQTNLNVGDTAFTATTPNYISLGGTYANSGYGAKLKLLDSGSTQWGLGISTAGINYYGSFHNFFAGTTTAAIVISPSADTASTSPAYISIGQSYSSVAGANPKLRLFGTTYGLGVSAGQVDYIAPSHVFYANGTEAMRITSAGYIGIGTTTPTELLHIVNNTTGNKFARISAGGSNASAAWVAQNDQVDNIVYRVFGSGVSGTQMGVNLARSASLIANLDGSGKFLIGTYSNTDVVFGAGDQERMRLINNTGNFLIGTTVDVGTKLNVSGDINAMGYRINNVIGYTGILNIPGNPPGMQNVDIQGGIIVNIF